MRKLLIFFMLHPVFAFSQTPEENFRIESSDAVAFWKAFDLFKSDTTLNPFAEYLNSGTAALKLLQQHRIKDASTFKSVIRKKMDYYEKVSQATFSEDTIETEVLKYFNAFKKIYPQATFPKVYFVVGQLNTNMTIVNDTVIVCIENFPNTTEAITTDRQSSRISDLPFLLAKALVYVNNKPAHTGHMLLRECILHGTVDFIIGFFTEGERLKIISGKNFEYGEAHEEQLAKEFMLMKNSTDFQNWFYQGNKTERPNELGKWIGYKIVEAYYDNASDKSRAIDEILKINDFDRFLQLSGYLDVFRN